MDNRRTANEAIMSDKSLIQEIREIETENENEEEDDCSHRARNCKTECFKSVRSN